MYGNMYRNITKKDSIDQLCHQAAIYGEIIAKCSQKNITGEKLALICMYPGVHETELIKHATSHANKKLEKDIGVLFNELDESWIEILERKQAIPREIQGAIQIGFMKASV